MTVFAIMLFAVIAVGTPPLLLRDLRRAVARRRRKVAFRKLNDGLVSVGEAFRHLGLVGGRAAESLKNFGGRL